MKSFHSEIINKLSAEYKKVFWITLVRRKNKLMTTNDIISILRMRMTRFGEVKTFSNQPGIYAFFFIGEEFPILGSEVQRNQLIYIGKTESSQEKRNVKTHFASGKTGSSTVRKSIGSLLCSQLSLKPIPRNEVDYEKGRRSHFKFSPKSEELITEWMKNNLGLSFFECPTDKLLINQLETELIQELCPILNIDAKNSSNPFKNQIRHLRKNCADMALKKANIKVESTSNYDLFGQEKSEKKNKIAANGSIIICNITNGDVAGKKLRVTVENKHIFPSEKVGSNISHSLNFITDKTKFIAKYSIGSKDGKSRSGILRLGRTIYEEALKIKPGTQIKISKSSGGTYYIEHL